MVSRLPIFGVMAIVATAALVGCTGSSGSGDTDSQESAVLGTQFVPTDDAAGGIQVSVASTTLSVGSVTSFTARVFNSAGNGVADMKVICDSELGIAITEPTTGAAMTGSNGQISGSIGCARIGSLVFGCRAANLGKRQFVTISCQGPVPTGFDGFPGAGGGGLGSGGSDSGDDGGLGGTNPDGVRITNVGFDDSGTGAYTDIQIDMAQDNDCDADVTTVDPEPFFDTTFKIKIVNNSNQAMTFTKYAYSIPEIGYSSGRRDFVDVGTIGTVPPDGGELSLKGFLFEAGGGKFPLDSSTPLAATGSTTIRFSLFGTNDSGDSVTLTTSVAPSISDYNRCD